MDGNVMIKVLVKWLHLSAAIVWLGAVFISPLVMIRLVQDERESVKMRLRKNYHHALTPIVWTALGVLGITGIYRAGHHLDHGIMDLFRTGWGHLLLAKLGVVALMITAALYRMYWPIPAHRSERTIQTTTLITAFLGLVLLWIITLL